MNHFKWLKTTKKMTTNLNTQIFWRTKFYLLFVKIFKKERKSQWIAPKEKWVWKKILERFDREKKTYKIHMLWAKNWREKKISWAINLFDRYVILCTFSKLPEPFSQLGSTLNPHCPFHTRKKKYSFLFDLCSEHFFHFFFILNFFYVCFSKKAPNLIYFFKRKFKNTFDS